MNLTFEEQKLESTFNKNKEGHRGPIKMRIPRCGYSNKGDCICPLFVNCGEGVRRPIGLFN